MAEPLLVLLVVAPVVWVLLAVRPSRVGQADNMPTATTASANQPAFATAVVTRFDDTIWDIDYDAAANVLWVADLTNSGGTIDRIEARTGATIAFPLPVVDNLNPGIFSRIVADGSGAVWILSNYTVVRLDPNDGTFATAELDLRTSDMLAGADDLTSVDAGTWISAVSPLANGIVIARHNVPRLTAFDGLMRERTWLGLPERLSGALGIEPLVDGASQLLTVGEQATEISMVDANGTVTARTSVDAAGIAHGFGSAVLVGRADNGRRLDAAGPAVVRSIGTVRYGDYALAYPNAKGGVDVYDDIAGTIDRIQDGETIATFSLPRHTVTDSISVPIMPESSAVDSGMLDIPERITAMVSDQDGNVWYAVAGANTLVRLSY